MASSSAVNLSLLSRGIGEVSKNGHEKIEVFFEPEDYYNWANNPKRVYLPPLKQQFHYNENPRRGYDLNDEPTVPLPKTFTTRKGALLLFSEDLATKNKLQNAKKRRAGRVTQSLDDVNLRTVDDLTRSILSYGKDDEDPEVYLGFVHPRKWYRETRRIRPGFSAKRYLATWTQSWDDTLLHKLLDKGYMSDNSLQPIKSSFIPNRRIRLYDDLSQCPAPYRLLRSMLLSPGSLAGYTFYRIRPESQQSNTFYKEDTTMEEKADMRNEILNIPQATTDGKIKVVQSKHGKIKEVEYNELDRNKQEEVLAELLVKSAVHLALQKQQDYMDDSITSHKHGTRLSVDGSIVSQEGRYKTSLPDFDMQEAVESLLDSQRGKPLLDGSVLSGYSGAKPLSDHGGSLRGRSVPQHTAHSFEAPRGRPYSNDIPAEGHFPTSFGSTSAESNKSEKPASLQQVSQQLPPIADEGTDIQAYSVLPPIAPDPVAIDENLDVPVLNIEPPTPQHSTLTNLPQSRQDTTIIPPSEPPATEISSQVEFSPEKWGADIPETEIIQREKEASSLRHQKETAENQNVSEHGSTPSPRSKGPILAAGSHLQSSRESLETLSAASQVHLPGTLPGWKGSQPSLKSGASKKGELHWMTPSVIIRAIPPQKPNIYDAKTETASSPRESSVKGSVVFGPDGAVINVGGAMTLRESPVSMTDMNKLLDGAESVISEDSGHLSDDEGGGVSFRSSAQPPSQFWGSGAEGFKQLPQKRDSGEINAGMSMHSWSYSPKDEETKSQRSHSQSHVSVRSNASSDRVSLAEQGLIDALTEHAQRIAASVLSQDTAGINLEEDIKTAASLWMDQHPRSVISRTQSLQEPPDNSAAAEIARSQYRKSADPTVAEYKELIRKTLTSAVARQMGMDDGELPPDTEISQELMEALTNKSLTPDELEIVRTDSGRSIIRARSSATASPLKEGHLYQPAPGKGGSHPSSSKSPKPPISIPNDRQNTADIGDLDVVNLGVAEQDLEQDESLSPTAGEKLSPTRSAKSDKSSRKLSVPSDDATAPPGGRSPGSGHSKQSDQSKSSAAEAKSPKQELADLMKELHVDSSSDKASPDDRRKSKGSNKSKKSRSSLDGRDEFVVGKVDNKKEMEKLYAPLDPPPKKETKVDGKPKIKKKGSIPSTSSKGGKKIKKKDKKKAEKDSASVSSQDVSTAVEKSPQVVVVLEDKKKGSEVKEKQVDQKTEKGQPVSPEPHKLEEDLSDYELDQLSPSPSKSGSEMDFIFVREESSASPEPDLPKSVKSAIPSPATLDVTDNEGDISDSSSTQFNLISNKDARAAKRAAQAEKRRQEVERKRREREEQLKREKEEFERQEMLTLELEEARRKKAEERRLKKLREEEELDRAEAMEHERQKREQQEIEREKRLKEEYQRKLEEVKRKQAELEQQKYEEMLIRQKEEEERRLEEERMLYEMAEHERILYEKKKKEDAERRKIEEEAARIRREEEAAKALEEARRLAEEMARKQAELEARLRFNRALMVESSGMDHTQDITRAFVYSYFELLQWLGLDIPEFDLQKLQGKF